MRHVPELGTGPHPTPPISGETPKAFWELLTALMFTNCQREYGWAFGRETGVGPNIGHKGIPLLLQALFPMANTLISHGHFDDDTKRLQKVFAALLEVELIQRMILK